MRRGQLLRVPRTVLAIRRILREDCSFEALDEHLWAFKGFHLESWDPHYRARSWEKAAMAAVGTHEVTGVDPVELAFMMTVAMEIEDPIMPITCPSVAPHVRLGSHRQR